MSERSSTDPRRQRTDDRLRAALRDLLAEVGYRALTIEAVAARSGVAKTTIYRRWSTKAEMAYDLLLHSAPTLPEVGGTGSLAGDVDSLVDRTIAFVAEEPGRTVLPGLLADMGADEALAARVRTGIVAAAEPLFDRVLLAARERGEQVRDVDAAELQAALVGAAFMATHVTVDVDPTALRRTLTAVATALIGPADSPA